MCIRDRLTDLAKSLRSISLELMEDGTTYQIRLAKGADRKYVNPVQQTTTQVKSIETGSVQADADRVTLINSHEALKEAFNNLLFQDEDYQANDIFSVDVEYDAKGELSLVQITSSEMTHVFDAKVLGSTDVVNTLKVLLENEKAFKLIHDLHSEAEIFGRGGIRLRGVFDTQLAAEYEKSGSFHTSFNAMLKHFGRPIHPHKASMNRQLNEKHIDPFAARPIPSYVLRYAVLDTQLLLSAVDSIKERIDDEVMKLLIVASEQRALFGQTRHNWRSVCFDTRAACKLASSELLENLRPEDMLQPQPLVIHDEVAAIVDIFPTDLAQSLHQMSKPVPDIVLDLGESPFAWSGKDRVPLGDETRRVSPADLDSIVDYLGSMGSDNRAGIEGKLHRVSVVRNRDDRVVGMTIRVGRHATGSTFLISDLLNSNANILFLGNPGTGKTTMIREVSRMLAQTDHVVIVDTSNEIAGDGDAKHISVGKARRMFVKNIDEQRRVMIECIQNHRPDVLVIDEIGRKKETEAARTAACRGVRLIASAHGSFRTLLQNPDTNGLLGGITKVIWGDKLVQENQSGHSKHESIRKTRDERATNVVFDVVVELNQGNGTACTVIQNTSEAVDRILEGRQFAIQRRSWDGSSKSISLQFDRV